MERAQGRKRLMLMQVAVRTEAGASGRAKHKVVAHAINLSAGGGVGDESLSVLSQPELQVRLSPTSNQDQRLTHQCLRH